MNNLPKLVIFKEDADNLQLVSLMSVMPQVELVQISSTCEFLNVLSRENLALVLMDIQKKNDDKLELLKRLRQNPETRTLPVILISNSFDYFEIKDIKPDLFDVILTPVIPEILLNKVKIFVDLFLYKRTIAKCEKSKEKSLPQGNHSIDLTKKLKTDQELCKNQKLEAIGKLAGGIAHDFNNILTGIMGYISLAKIAFERGESPLGFLIASEESCNRAQGLSSRLLTFSKGGEPVTRPLNIVNLLKDAVSLAFCGSNVQANFSIPPQLWDVAADDKQIIQVLTNIFLNAKEAMPQGGLVTILAENVEIDADSHSIIREGDYVKITISDEGSGITNHDLINIFNPFFTTKSGKSGLGLTATYSIIKNHDGYINIESEPGKGTVVEIFIPSAKVKDKQEENHECLKGEGNVLIMDDEQVIRDSLSQILSRLGYTVECAQNGEETIDKYRRAQTDGKPFDVVLMDLTIQGGMGGNESLKKLLNIDQNAKVIVSSGYANNVLMSHYKDYGFYDFVAKPYKIEELLKRLYQAVQGNGKYN